MQSNWDQFWKNSMSENIEIQKYQKIFHFFRFKTGVEKFSTDMFALKLLRNINIVWPKIKKTSFWCALEKEKGINI